MTRIEVVVGVFLWAGCSLLLSQLRRVGAESLAERLEPFHPGSQLRPAARAISKGSVAGVLVPLAGNLGDRVSRLFGIVASPDERLRRIHSRQTGRTFRTRQMVWSTLTLVAAAVIAGSAHLTLPLAVLVLGGLPLLVFLLIEHDLERRSKRWQATTALELPVVEEQLAMLLNAGFSLNAALARSASRGAGCVAVDLRVAMNRVAQGLSQADALAEWADLAGCDGVTRLVRVLTLHSDASDLARLVSAEARQARRELHTRTIAQIDRRAEQVWIPVTVAALVPGTILLAVPFLDALRIFANA